MVPVADESCSANARAALMSPTWRRRAIWDTKSFLTFGAVRKYKKRSIKIYVAINHNNRMGIMINPPFISKLAMDKPSSGVASGVTMGSVVI